MVVAWTKPYNGGTALTKAKIEILESDGTTWTEDTTNCDGSNSVVFAAKQCTLSMKTVLRASPYNLDFKDEIKARITFTNDIGDSLTSDETTSPPTIQTEPVQPTVAPARNV